MNTELHKKIEKKHSYFFKYLDEEETPMIDTEKPIVDSVQKLLKQDKIVVPMQFGIECEDGWFWLLDNLLSSIKWHIDQENENRKKEPKYKWLNMLSYKLRVRTSFKRKILRKIGEWIYDKQPRGVDPLIFRVTQIKEKYGMLCFYYYGGDKFIDGMVNLAESMSYSICEFCGTTQDVGHTEGWVYTICHSCREKNSKANLLNWIKIE